MSMTGRHFVLGRGQPKPRLIGPPPTRSPRRHVRTATPAAWARTLHLLKIHACNFGWGPLRPMLPQDQEPLVIVEGFRFKVTRNCRYPRPLTSCGFGEKPHGWVSPPSPCKRGEGHVFVNFVINSKLRADTRLSGCGRTAALAIHDFGGGQYISGIAKPHELRSMVVGPGKACRQVGSRACPPGRRTRCRGSKFPSAEGSVRAGLIQLNAPRCVLIVVAETAGGKIWRNGQSTPPARPLRSRGRTSSSTSSGGQPACA